jgi:hypothetical protein
MITVVCSCGDIDIQKKTQCEKIGFQKPYPRKGSGQGYQALQMEFI